MSTGPPITEPAEEEMGLQELNELREVTTELREVMNELREVTDMPIPEIVEAAEVTDQKGAENGEARARVEVKEVSPPRYE